MGEERLEEVEAVEGSSEDGFWTQQDSCIHDLMGAVAANTETAHSSHTKSQHGGVGQEVPHLAEEILVADVHWERESSSLMTCLLVSTGCPYTQEWMVSTNWT